MPSRPKIQIIYTGGTIGMTVNPNTGALQPFDFDHLIDNVPKVSKLGYDIEHTQFTPPLDSANINPNHWAIIAHTIEQHYDNADGFVVLHGTDTMAFTASALSFMLENLHKPVIITGSQLPVGQVRTDGEENLITALQVAAAIGSDGEPRVQEVAILFEDFLWRGNRSTKMSADNFNAFQSNNYPALARIGLDITFNNEALYRNPSRRPLKVHDHMDTNVMFVELHPGITPELLAHQFSAPGLKGIVLKTYGSGNGPSEPWFADLIEKTVARGVVILNVTQCVSGGVDGARYDTGNRLSAAGVVSGRDITSEAAITKMMYLFGLGLDPTGVVRYLNNDLCGEVSI